MLLCYAIKSVVDENAFEMASNCKNGGFSVGANKSFVDGNVFVDFYVLAYRESWRRAIDSPYEENPSNMHTNAHAICDSHVQRHVFSCLSIEISAVSFQVFSGLPRSTRRPHPDIIRWTPSLLLSYHSLLISYYFTNMILFSRFSGELYG